MRLPQGWTKTTLGDLAHWGSGGTPKASNHAFYGGTIPWVRSGDLPDGPITAHEVTISEEGYANSSAKWVSEGAVLIAMYGATIGKLGITTYPVTTNQAVAFIQPAEGISNRFIFQNLRSRKANFIALGQGGAQPNISQEILRAQPILLPPSAEQRRIVAKLDALTARLARARAELDRVPVLARHLRDVALTAAFDGLLIEEAGPTKSEWVSVPFRDAADIASNLVDPRTIGALPHIAPNHIASGLPHLLSHNTIAEDKVISGKHRFYPGQILYSKIRPYLRKVVLVDFEGACSADMYPINARCNSRYLMYWMLSPQFTWLAAQQQGRTILPKINQNALNAIITPLAPKHIQAAIADRLNNIFARADRLEAEAIRARALIDRLEAAILAKAFRGELVPQDPDDEPASVLLDRIRAERAAAPKVKRGRQAKATSGN